jgi:hypothetical protein
MLAKLKAAWVRSKTLFIAKGVMLASAVVEAADQVGAIDIAPMLSRWPALVPFAPFIVALVMHELRRISTGPVRDPSPGDAP